MAGAAAPSEPKPAPSTNKARNSPFLPTPTELALLATYPAILAFGAVFRVLSPDTRAAPYDDWAQAHVQDPAVAPSYFARKDNLLNTLFVKRGWAWITVAFAVFVLTHPATAGARRRAQAGARWLAVTAWWFAVTQWFFGPALIDRSFRVTGGKCEVVETRVEADGDAAGPVDVLTAVACKSAGGAWRGGHDISGHVFMLVLGSFFLLQEVGWVALRWGERALEERSIVMHDGAVKGASVEAEPSGGRPQTAAGTDVLGIGGKFAAVVVALSWWMILMTAIYFHTWFEKFTGLLVALTGVYSVYILPRWIPALRGILGLPGI